MGHQDDFLNTKTVFKIKANSNGTDVWQLRKISTQNSLGSMNSLNVEFGFGAATTIDSIFIIWSSGHNDTYVNISADFFLISGISLPCNNRSGCK